MVVLVMPPPMPVIYSVFVPVVGLLSAVNVNSVVPGGVTGFGENEAVTPAGKLDTENVTAFVKPPVVVTETRKDELELGLTVNWLGSMVKLKSGGTSALANPKPNANTATDKLNQLIFFIRFSQLLGI
jgi:hypothetical protein